MKQAVILAGGKGTRLGNITINTPKPLLDVSGCPFIIYQMKSLANHGFRNQIILVGPFEDIFRSKLQYLEKELKINIKFIPEKEPSGTAGALWEARDFLEENFLLLNGDCVFDLNYLDLVMMSSSFNNKDYQTFSIALRKESHAMRFGVVKLEENKITGFFEKNEVDNGIINGGVYYLNKSILNYISKIPCSLEKDIFPILSDKGFLFGKVYNGIFLDIGTPEDFIKSKEFVDNWFNKPIAFLDRDGVINVDIGYLYKPEDFIWNEGAIQAIKFLNDNNFFVIVVTNQSGVARGYYKKDDVDYLHCWMNDQLSYFGAHIDHFYYCHHMASDPPICSCRKPMPGMLFQAFHDWSGIISQSFLIGDKISDIEAANSAGISGFLYKSGNLSDFIRKITYNLVSGRK